MRIPGLGKSSAACFSSASAARAVRKPLEREGFSAAKETITIFNAATAEVGHSVTVAGFGARSLSFSPHSRLVASAWRDGKVRLWNWEDGSELRAIDAYRLEARSVDFHPQTEKVREIAACAHQTRFCPGPV